MPLYIADNAKTNLNCHYISLKNFQQSQWLIRGANLSDDSQIKGSNKEWNNIERYKINMEYHR